MATEVPAQAPLTENAAETAVADSGEDRYPLFLWPLVAFNQVFDIFLRLWGAPGRWFCGRAGRFVLGAMGLLCLLAAGALVLADGMGWTW
jgi:hypothetical protein